MYKTPILLIMLVFLMSFTTGSGDAIQMDAQGSAFRKKYIDVTVTASNGCTVQIKGYIEYTTLPPKFQGFEGTITIGGPSSCPHITLAIEWHARTQTPGKAGLTFDKEELCAVTKAQWTAEDRNIETILNDSSFNEALVSAIKEGECK